MGQCKNRNGIRILKRNGQKTDYAKKRQNKFLKLSTETKGCCAYCRIRLDEFTATFDHVVPKSVVKSDRVGVLVLSCDSCNSNKRNLSLDDWRKLFRKIYKKRCFAFEALLRKKESEALGDKKRYT